MEYEYEKEEFKRQTETMGIARKVKRGLCWHPVSPGRSYYNSLNQLVIDITRTENKEIEHSFEFGRPVCFFHQSLEGKMKYMNFIATVSYADEERMVVVLPGAGALAELQTPNILIGVQLYFDETSYRAMFEALEDVIRAKGNRLAELRDTFLGTQKPRFRELYPVRFPWLNNTQEAAVNKVLCTRDVSIVHGPPGTGKTTTLVEAIYETLHREPQVLVCAQSNTAVDWICEKLVDRGVTVLRIGNPTRVNDKMLSSTYERRFESHPAYPELWSIRKSIREMNGRMRRGSYTEREGMRNRMNRLRDRATELEILINADLFDSARVIASTLVSSNHRLLNGRRFPTLFIDEAAPEVRHRGILDFDTPMNWIDTSGMDFHEEFVGESFGRINKEEANLLLQELETYINRIGKERILEERIDFGLISPYKAQVQYLKSKIKGSSFLRPFRSLITVNTVDGFQGQERDVIFISLVRANEDGQIGFLNDLRRMNVAITRARMKLVILGDAATLTRHPFYKRLMSFIKKQFIIG